MSGNVHYGWAQITRIDDDNFTLHGFGYNSTPGSPSTAIDTIDVLLPGDGDGDGDIDDTDLGTAFASYSGPDGSGLTVAEVQKVDALAEMARLGLNDHLSAQRSNGLRAMIERIRLVTAE